MSLRTLTDDTDQQNYVDRLLDVRELISLQCYAKTTMSLSALPMLLVLRLLGFNIIRPT